MILHAYDRLTVCLPYSEVCMHLRVSGETRTVEVTPNGMAQIMGTDGKPFSFPVLLGEAGIHASFTNAVGPLCVGCSRIYSAGVNQNALDSLNGYEQHAADGEYALVRLRTGCMSGTHHPAS